jgi:hypothetical protein
MLEVGVWLLVILVSYAIFCLKNINSEIRGVYKILGQIASMLDNNHESLEQLLGRFSEGITVRGAKIVGALYEIESRVTAIAKRGVSPE